MEEPMTAPFLISDSIAACYKAKLAYGQAIGVSVPVYRSLSIEGAVQNLGVFNSIEQAEARAEIDSLKTHKCPLCGISPDQLLTPEQQAEAFAILNQKGAR